MPAVHHATLLLLAMLIAAAPCAPVAAGEGTAGGGGAADTTPPSPPTGEQVQAAVAAVLVATLGERFPGTTPEVRLGTLEIESTGPRDHVAHCVGFLQFTGDGGDEWLAFRYRTRYDPLFGTAGYPEIALGGNGEADGERFVPNDATLLGDLEARVAADLEAYPGAGRVYLQLDDISSIQSGERFVHIEADGVADFGTGGNTPAKIEAVYDLRTATWLSIETALGPNIRAGEDATAAVP